MEHSLKATQLTKRYQMTMAVDGVSVTLGKGRIYGLLGPNGSGKTTFMKIAAGLVRPTSGSIEIMGLPAGNEARADLVFMPTEPYFYSYMTVRQVGDFHSDFYADFSTYEYENNLEAMGLNTDMNISELSSGMAAKLKLATATARSAGLIMLDEPLNGIDLITRDAILAAITEKANENNTILISSHLIDVIEDILDDVMFIKEGRIVLNGTVDHIRTEHGKSIVDIYREVFAP